MARALFLLLFTFATGALATYFYQSTREARGPAAGADPVSLSGGLAGNQLIESSRRNAIVAAAERVSPSVVTVSALKVRLVRSGPYPNTQNEFFNQFLLDFWPNQVYRQDEANMGSGLIVNDKGYIVTNSHVVKDAERIEVVLGDGRQFEAKLVGTDATYDLAVIRIEGENLPVAPLGNSDDLMIGEWAIAIGNPFGYLLNNTEPSVTAGVISALHRDINPEKGNSGIYKDMIQTDAAINPGNSGGPLVNGEGEVIGINTFIFTRGGGSLGIGFATPIKVVRRIVAEVVQYGEVRTPWVGVRVVDITTRLQRLLNLPSKSGVVVSYVDPGSPAEVGGVEIGDMIFGIGGEIITKVDDAQRALHGIQVGDRLLLEILREDGTREFSLELKESPHHRRAVP